MYRTLARWQSTRPTPRSVFTDPDLWVNPAVLVPVCLCCVSIKKKLLKAPVLKTEKANFQKKRNSSTMLVQHEVGEGRVMVPALLELTRVTNFHQVEDGESFQTRELCPAHKMIHVQKTDLH